MVRYTSRADLGALYLLPESTRAAVEVVYGDLKAADSVRAAMRDCDVVLHLGALIAIPFSYVSPDEAVDVNVRGTANVLAAARDLGVRRLVHTSTSEVYGTARYVPMDEAHPLQGQSPYSASKIGADKLVESFVKSFNVPAVTLRPFNTFGPRQSTRAVIPTIITQLLRQQPVKLGSLHPSRDFTFVTDTVAGFIKAAETPGIEGEEINLGTGVEISVADLATRLAALCGQRLEVVTEDQRLRPAASEVDRLCANNEKARRLMGWAPAVSLDEGLSRTIDWVREHLGFYTTETYHR
jgi:dTDP-glucose 4,6-dehydratase